MTADYTRVASYDVRKAILQELVNAKLINLNSYIADGFTKPLEPIIPAQQVPEFNNLMPAKTYIIYDVIQKSRGVQWWISEESMTLEITSTSSEEVQTIINFLIDLVRRYDLSAKDINLEVNPTSPFTFLWFHLESADPIQPFQTEGGFMTGMLTFHYAYTRQTDPLTGRYI
jgi:hypothetical protein